MSYWRRADLKEKAKRDLHSSYWKCVLAAILMMFSVGGSKGYSGIRIEISNGHYEFKPWYHEYHFQAPQGFDLTVIAGILIVIGVIAAVIVIVFLLNPLEVGCCNFFVRNLETPSELSEINAGFSTGYKNIVKVQFFRDLYIFLWSLLFVVPGILKAYDYRLVPYILAEQPELDKNDALNLSRQMMDGEKWNAFVLDLSFFGWEILASLTFGLLIIFFVNPYIDQTNAALYQALKQKQFVQY